MARCKQCECEFEEDELTDEYCEECIDILEDDDTDYDPDHGDIGTDDHRKFYQYGKLWLSIGEDDDMKAAVRARMELDRFYPNVFWISDHGNTVLLDIYEEDDADAE